MTENVSWSTPTPSPPPLPVSMLPGKVLAWEKVAFCKRRGSACETNGGINWGEVFGNFAKLSQAFPCTSPAFAPPPLANPEKLQPIHPGFTFPMALLFVFFLFLLTSQKGYNIISTLCKKTALTLTINCCFDWNLYICIWYMELFYFIMSHILLEW